MTQAAESGPETCPKCSGKRTMLLRIVDGKEQRASCPICRGAGTCSPSVAHAFRRVRRALEEE